MLAIRQIEARRHRQIARHIDAIGIDDADLVEDVGIDHSPRHHLFQVERCALLFIARFHKTQCLVCTAKGAQRMLLRHLGQVRHILHRIVDRTGAVLLDQRIDMHPQGDDHQGHRQPRGDVRRGGTALLEPMFQFAEPHLFTH